MNRNKKTEISNNMAIQILMALKSQNCFDGFISRFYNKTKCINYFQDCVNEYFHKGNKLLLNWNKLTWLDIFDDEYLADSIVHYMQDFNLNKEFEEDEELKNKRKYERSRNRY